MGVALLKVRDLTVRRGRKIVLSGVDLDVEAGEIVALVGPNGCGKSSLMGSVVGLYEPRRGEVQIQGRSAWGPPDERADARRAQGYLPGGADGGDPMGFLHGRELWALVAATRGAPPPTEELRAALGLDELAELTIEQMSLGQRRRACLAAAMLGPPPLLVLDEPDNGIDPARIERLVELLVDHRAHGGVLLASHDPELLRRLDARVVALG
ncbi:MAG: ABC transporter ATP-binding protein [Kofleriaceae bacterium]